MQVEINAQSMMKHICYFYRLKRRVLKARYAQDSPALLFHGENSCCMLFLSKDMDLLLGCVIVASIVVVYNQENTIIK